MVGKRTAVQRLSLLAAVTDEWFESQPAVAHEPPAHVAADVVGGVDRERFVGERDDLLGDLDLAIHGAPGDDLERVAVAVAAREVHHAVGLGGVLAQDGLGDRDALEELAPVQRVEQPDAGDGVGDGHLVGSLFLLRIGGRDLEHDSFCREASLQPGVDRLASGLQLTEPLGEPHEESGRHVAGLGVDRCEQRGQRRGVVLRTEDQALGPAVAVLLGTHRDDHRPREASEVLDQRDAEHDRDRPHFADRQRRDLLVAADKPQQVLLVDAGVGVRDDIEQCLVDAREAVPFAADQPRKLEAVVGREVLVDQQDLLLDQVEVVEQPLTCGRGASSQPGGGRQFAVVRRQRTRSLPRGSDERRGAYVTAHRPRLCGRDDAGIVSKPFRREEFGAQRLCRRDVRAAGRFGRVGHESPRGRITAAHGEGFAFTYSGIYKSLSPSRP